MADKTKQGVTAPVAKTAAPSAFKLLDSTSAIEGAIKSIHGRGQSLQKDIHIAACSVLAHVAKHSDVRLVAKLIAAMPEFGRANALREWFVAFGPVLFDDKGVCIFVKDKATAIGAAMAMPFYKFSPEKPYMPLDMVKALDSFIKRITTDAKETGTDHALVLAALERIKTAAEAKAN